MQRKQSSLPFNFFICRLDSFSEDAHKINANHRVQHKAKAELSSSSYSPGQATQALSPFLSLHSMNLFIQPRANLNGAAVGTSGGIYLPQHELISKFAAHPKHTRSTSRGDLLQSSCLSLPPPPSGKGAAPKAGWKKMSKMNRSFHDTIKDKSINWLLISIKHPFTYVKLASEKTFPLLNQSH